MLSKTIFTPLEEAIAEINTRRRNTELVLSVEKYLKHEAPEHFKQEKPILYLARHLATPNFETLRFIELATPYKLPIVIGQDLNAKFVSNNSLKKSLAKLYVHKATARTHDEVVESFTIIDFDKNQGKSFNEIQTTFGKNIAEFHTELFKEIYPSGIHIADESHWIDKNLRENLQEHYKRFLSLFVVHGIMFEWYPDTEQKFFDEIVEPAFLFVEKQFGHKPLIVNLLDPHIEYEKNWEAYPSVLYQTVKQKLSHEVDNIQTSKKK